MASKITMADIRRRANAAGSHYFDRAATKFFGGDKFFGPYSGKGGVFFVANNRAGWMVKRFGEDDRVHPVSYEAPPGMGGEKIREFAKRMAKGS
jgi:hypothetical protein